MRVPRPPSGLGDLLNRWAREMTDWAEASEDKSSTDTLLSRTTQGTSRSAIAGSDGGPGESTELQFREQWVATTDYVEGDLVRCDLTAERENGTQAGFYRCIADKAGDPGNAHPSADPTHWVMEVRGNWQYLYLVAGTKRIELDLRDDKYQIKVYNSATSAPGSLTLDLADIPEDAGDKEIKFRETGAKDMESGLCYKCIIPRSDFYL